MILRHHRPFYITQILQRTRKGKHFLQETCQTWRMDSFIDSIVYPFLDMHELPSTDYLQWADEESPPVLISRVDLTRNEKEASMR